MAATEVIHFPLSVQLGPRLAFPDQIPFEPGRPFPPKRTSKVPLHAYSGPIPSGLFCDKTTSHEPQIVHDVAVRGTRHEGLRLTELERGDHRP